MRLTTEVVFVFILGSATQDTCGGRATLSLGLILARDEREGRERATAVVEYSWHLNH